ncbi:MAG: Na+/H+ antiporter NhaC [Endozoicomonas sp.]
MQTTETPHFNQALLCFGGIFGLISIGSSLLDVSLHILLIASLAWVSLHAKWLGYSFSNIRQSMNDGIQKGLGAIYIFILIGMLVAAFIESGTVAYLIYYGLEYLSPGLFLPVGLILCTLMSLATGTAWGTVATAGVVLLEIGSALNIPLPIVAGMVVSGASFGDKMSLISDTTNLAAMSAGSRLYEHIKSMSMTSAPSYLITLVAFTFIGLSFTGGSYNAGSATTIQAGLNDSFNIGFWSLLPIITLILLSKMRVAPELAMLSSILAAGLVALATQGVETGQFLSSLQYGHHADTGLESLNNLLNRGGIQSMMWTLSLSLIALALGGVLDRLGILQVLLKALIHRVKRTSSLLATTIGTGVLSNMCLGEAYLSIILGGQLYKKTYTDKGLHPSMLSRSLEQGATLSAGLIPWTTAGLFYAATLGMPVLDFAPWALFNLITPLLSVALASLGIGVYREQQADRNAMPHPAA